ncbi:MAG: UDP-N-acetylmuramoyl-tripeptide--D-alanyl-D-alanine ligase, partial [Alcaligenaceae bacterium]
TKTAFVNLDDPIQAEKTATLPRYTFATDSYDGDVRVENIEANPMVSLIFNELHIQSNLIGIYNAANISAAIAIGTYFKVADNQIKAAIEGYIPNNNRSQIMALNGNSIILDAYNANPSSMAAAITNLQQLDTQNKIAILGDMFELGPESPEEHRKVIGLLTGQDSIEVHFVGKDFYSNKVEQSNLHFHESFENLKNYLCGLMHKLTGEVNLLL